MRLRDCAEVRRVFVRKTNESEGRWLELGEVEALGLMEVEGELLGESEWGALYAAHPDYATILAAVVVDPDGPAFHANTQVRDAEGRPLVPGQYEVRRGGQVRVGAVCEAEDGALYVAFAGDDRPQRVDEMTRACTWRRIERLADVEA